MDAPAIPLRIRLVVVVFLLVWGADQTVTVWQGVRGGIPAFMVLVTSATGPEDNGSRGPPSGRHRRAQ